MKKMAIAAALMLLCATLSGCYAGQLYSELSITSPNGAGTKVIYIEIWKDHATKPDGAPVGDNSAYFPNGVEAVADWLEQNVPAGFDVDLVDDPDKHIISITYSFNDIDEYNAKTKTLLGSSRWDAAGLNEATLAQNGLDVTITVDPRALYEIGLRYMEYIYNDPQLFDPHDAALVDTFEVRALIIDITGNRKTLQWDPANPAEEFTHTGTVNMGKNGWYLTNARVSFSATDNFAGVKMTEYRINNGSWIKYIQPFTLSQEGVLQIDYRSIDFNDNVEDFQTDYIKIDKSLPELDVTVDQPVISPADDSMVQIEVDLDYSDAVSGIDSVQLLSITSNQELDPGDVQGADFGTEDTVFSLRATRSQNEDRIYTITYLASDEAGNKVQKSATVTVTN